MMRSDALSNVPPMQSSRRAPAPANSERSGQAELSAISLFSGAGGLDLGCERAGFATRAAVEHDPVAKQTLLANAERWLSGIVPETLFSDIVTLDHAALLDAAGLAAGQVDLLHGGPPCTPFSKSGYWLAYKRAGADPKASLLDNYVEALRAIRPRAFLMENVYGLAYQNQNRAILKRFIAAVRDAGYSLDSRIILAADHGVPQIRQRLFCVGVRRDLLDVSAHIWRFDWPAETHAGPHERRVNWEDRLLPHVTASQALAGLTAKQNQPEPEEVIDGTYAQELREIPPGDNYLYFTAKRGHPEPRFKWRSRYWSFLLKLHPDRTSATIQGQPGPWVGPFHWESRRLRAAELRRLMTFPDDYIICGNRREQQLQLGNAVPPLLAERLASQLAGELERLGVTERVALAA